jgi:hypothetical protein
VRAKSEIGVSHQVGRESFGELGVDTAPEEYVAKLFTFQVGFVLERATFHVNLVPVELFLCPHREVLATAHRKGARHQSGESGEANYVVAGIGAGEAEDERDVRDQSVHEAKEGRAKAAVTDLAVVRGAGEFAHAVSLRRCP